MAVEFALTNTGQHDTGEVKVNLYVRTAGDEPGDPELADTKIVSTVVVGDPATGTFNWDTAEAEVGDYQLELVTETFGDTDATNNTVSTSIEIRNWLTLKKVSPASAEAVTGDTVEFTAQVENVGTGELNDVTVGLYESLVSTPLRSTTIASIAAGSTASATIEWDTASWDVGQIHLFVAARANDQDPDRDDTQSVNVTIRNPIALSSAVPASTDNVAGLPVTINVQVLNESDADASDVAVKLDGLYVGDCQNKDRVKQYGCASIATIAAITAGETGAAVLEWDTADVAPGEQKLKIVASLAGYDSDANDAASLAIDLRDPIIAVELAAVTINRNVAAVGQALKVTATITNHGEVTESVPMALYLVAENQGTTAAARETSPPIEAGASAKVTLPMGLHRRNCMGRHKLKVAARTSGGHHR